MIFFSIIVYLKIQYCLFYFLTYNKKILYHYSIYFNLDLRRKVLKKVFYYCKILKNIADCRLWNYIKDLLKIGKKIYKNQIIFKLNNAHLGLVIWK